MSFEFKQSPHRHADIQYAFCWSMQSWKRKEKSVLQAKNNNADANVMFLPLLSFVKSFCNSSRKMNLVSVTKQHHYASEHTSLHRLSAKTQQGRKGCVLLSPDFLQLPPRGQVCRKIVWVRGRLIEVAGVGVPWSGVLLQFNNTTAYTERSQRKRSKVCVANPRKKSHKWRWLH